MSEQNTLTEPTEQTEPTEKKAEKQTQRRDPIVTTIAVFLLIAAGFMYIKDIRDYRNSVKSAAEIRACAAFPAIGMTLSFMPEGRAYPVLVQCPPDILTNTVSILSETEAVKNLPDKFEGTPFEITLIHTNAMRSLFYAIAPNDAKFEGCLLVGRKTPTKFDDKNKPTEWEVGPATKVTDKDGKITAFFNDAIVRIEKLPPDSEIAELISNRVEAASTSAPAENKDPQTPEQTDISK